MARRLLLAAVCVLPQIAPAETLVLPDIGVAPEIELPACLNIPYSQDNCVRTLACVGKTGLYFDGQARGWDDGVVVGWMSDGTPCAGHWKSGGFMGTGRAQLRCEGDVTVNVLYYNQHNETGTVSGSGFDSTGRAIKVWSGENVLQYLTEEGAVSATLTCGETPVPIS